MNTIIENLSNPIITGSTLLVFAIFIILAMLKLSSAKKRIKALAEREEAILKKLEIWEPAIIELQNKIAYLVRENVNIEKVNEVLRSNFDAAVAQRDEWKGSYFRELDRRTNLRKSLFRECIGRKKVDKRLHDARAKIRKQKQTYLRECLEAWMKIDKLDYKLNLARKIIKRTNIDKLAEKTNRAQLELAENAIRTGDIELLKRWKKTWRKGE